MTWLLLAQTTDLTDVVKTGGPFAAGAAAVLVAGRLGWIRFPPSPEQTADKARYEALIDKLLADQGTLLTDAIVAIKEGTAAAQNTVAAVGRSEAASTTAAAELARLTMAAGGIARALAASKEERT